ncbi:pentatricopeptide repeat-containing protein-like [Dorcoceras hygrometricum]|uniref:Pentatricopeptide repeat-containing protein-like n=1 Tax=Dorcoceras hygrometricum TaxID=472368 RepID=A0A2Z7BSR7_9LAMI|nr:pentatricopeptide repeat-containing protein-like [Dorcoceras hygrometricum]
MVKRLATSRHDPLGITDSACKNQLVVVSAQYGTFNTYIPIRSTTIDSIGYLRMRASGESSTTKHRLLHVSGPHPILPPNDHKGQSSQPPAKRPYQGPLKGPSPQGQQQQRQQGQQRPQQEGASAPRPVGFPVCKEYHK